MSEEAFKQVYHWFANDEPASALHKMHADPASDVYLGIKSDYQLYAPTGKALEGYSEESDRVLKALDIVLCRINAPAEDENATSVAPFIAIAARLGLLQRILAMSWHHLSGRKSFGIKTTKHQLVKAEFAELSNQSDLLCQQWLLRLRSNDNQDTDEDHWQITVMTNRAEKLMGGHGYLLGASHSFSWLSMMMYSVYGKKGCSGAAPASLPVGG
jgi:hypothetical protein